MSKVMMRGGIPCPYTVEGQKYAKARADGVKAVDEYAEEVLDIELDGRQTLENIEQELIDRGEV